MVAGDPPLAKADEGPDEVGRRQAEASCGAFSGSGSRGGSGSGRSTGASIGSTTMVLEGPVKVTPEG
jgi:hypothetical protein